MAPDTAAAEYVVDLTATLTARVTADSVQDARDEVRSWVAYDPSNLPLTEITVHEVAVAMEGVDTTDEPALFGDFEQAVTRACRRVHMDSNDSEIARLWDAVEAACSLLGVDLAPIREKAEAWAKEKGYL